LEKIIASFVIRLFLVLIIRRSVIETREKLTFERRKSSESLIKLRIDFFFLFALFLWKLLRLILAYCIVILIVLWNKAWVRVDKEVILKCSTRYLRSGV